VLRRSDESERVLKVAVAVSEVLTPFGQFLQTPENVSAREILPGVTKILPRHAEVLSGFTEVIVAMMAMVVVVAMVTVAIVLLEQSLQEIETDTLEHSFISFSLGVPASASCRRPGPRCTFVLRKRKWVQK
jgi:hypothetical protein